MHVHVHVQLPSRQDAQPPVPRRHIEEGADKTHETHKDKHRGGGGARRCEGEESGSKPRSPDHNPNTLVFFLPMADAEFYTARHSASRGPNCQNTRTKSHRVHQQ